jgi:hypothetical protein
MIRYLFLILCYCSALTGALPEALYLTWQKDPTSTMTIHWLTKKEDTVDSIEYQKKSDAPDSGWKKETGVHHELPENQPYNIHVIELVNLDSDCTYRFRIGAEKAEYLFRTMPKTLDSPVRFVVGGDLLNDYPEFFEKMVVQAAETNPRFTLVGGDIAYSVTDKKKRTENFGKWLHFLTSWTKAMKDSQGVIIPIIPAIGNHEVRGYYDQTPNEALFFYSLFSMPGKQGYNILRFNNYLSIALLDSGHTHPVSGEQTKWLEAELKKQPGFTHRFAIYHVPAYPSVRYFRGFINSSIRRNWCPLFETYGVHTVFENHDHAYKRTHPLLDGAPDKFGVVYIGDGGWGIKTREPKKAERTSYLAKSQNARQFIQVDLTKTTRTFQAISPDGKVIDRYEQMVDKPSLLN